MEWLNYHHLLYFWTVAREGGIAAASRTLHVGRSSISQQLKSLEDFCGEPLFIRRGRYLELTEMGKLVQGYADDIFESGRELVDAVRGRPVDRPQKLRIGIVDVMAKMVAFQLLMPALRGDERIVLECREDQPDKLFAKLALREIDLVLSDIAMPPGLGIRAYSLTVGESATTLFAAPELYNRIKDGFPKSLNGSPFLMPSPGAAIRLSLEHWFEHENIHPEIIGEFDDSALMKVFGQAGLGVFAAPSIVSDEVCEQYGVEALGELSSVRERFYAISLDRKIKHPAIVRIVEHAKSALFR